MQKQIRPLLTQYLIAEQERLVLWVPVLFAAGILAFFAMDTPPHPMQLALWPAAVGMALFSIIRRRAWVLLWVAVALFFSGLAWSTLYTQSRTTQMLTKETRIGEVRGTLTRLEQSDKGWRVTIDRPNVEKLTPDETPSSVRLNIRGRNKPDVRVGDVVSLRAGLLPPSGPVMRGGFDFARFFFFRDIGAVGYGLPPITRIEKATQQPPILDVQQTRADIAERLQEQLGARVGAVAAALMIGDRTAISDNVLDAMRISNLSHILAISGMHMALITGLVFFAVRYALVLLPPTQHSPHNKKVAAALGLLCGAVYLVLADYPISAVRAFVMVALLLGAVLLDREVQPMRSLAWAAMLLLLYNPANVLEPGFQLSFMATMGLIAWYEVARTKKMDELAEDETRSHKSFWRRVGIYLGAIMLTTLVAELVTTPLVIYHFNNASFYGVVANLIVMPIVAFVVMPCVVLTYLLWATPLADFTIMVMGYGIEVMLIVADYIRTLPYAEQFLPAPNGWWIALASFGLVWLCLMRERWRFWGLPLTVLGVLPILLHQTPDFYISQDRGQIALKLEGELQMVKGRGNSFAPRQWANGNGRTTLAEYKGEKECDAVGCVYTTLGKRVGVYEDYKIVPKGYCPKLDVLLATFYWNGACEPDFMIDRNDIDAHGAHWGWLDRRVKHTDMLDGERRWSRY